jgi:hypothetical protein
MSLGRYSSLADLDHGVLVLGETMYPEKAPAALVPQILDDLAQDRTRATAN